MTDTTPTQRQTDDPGDAERPVQPPKMTVSHSAKTIDEDVSAHERDYHRDAERLQRLRGQHERLTDWLATP